MSQKTKTGFVKFENLNDEFQVAEILISSKDIPDETIKKRVKGFKNLFLKSAIVFLSITIVISFFYFHLTLFTYRCNYTEKKNLTDFQQQSLSRSEQGTGTVFTSVPIVPFPCFPLKPVNKVIVTLTQAKNSSCWESAACLTLQQKIEEAQDGLKYNFVIGAGLELYIGLGFKCQVNTSENVLHIKLLRNDSSQYLRLEEEIRVAEIIRQGRWCSKILPDYSFSTVCSEDLHLCKPDRNLVENSNLHSLAVLFSSKASKVNDPNFKFGTLLHRDVNWIACEDTMKETKDIIKSEVIKLESIDNCLPYEPVTEIVIDITNSPEISCGTTDNSSCADVVKTIEQLHDGLKYNFVIGTHLDLYVGLGFRCAAIPTNTLRIKILRLNDISQQQILTEMYRFSELIEQGRSCGKILPNYTITVNCQHSEYNGACSSMIQDLEEDNAFIVRLYATSWRRHHYDDQGTQRKVIQPHLKWMACHRNHSHNTLKIETDEHEVVSTEHPHVTTPLTTITKSHQYEETTQQTTNPPTGSAEYLDMTYSDITDYYY